MSTPNKVRVTVTDGYGRKQVHEDDVVETERTPGVAAHDLIASLHLHDGDTLHITFLYPRGTEWDE